MLRRKFLEFEVELWIPENKIFKSFWSFCPLARDVGNYGNIDAGQHVFLKQTKHTEDVIVSNAEIEKLVTWCEEAKQGMVDIYREGEVQGRRWNLKWVSLRLLHVQNVQTAWKRQYSFRSFKILKYCSIEK